MKEIYKVRKQIEKELINKLMKSNRKLHLDQLWDEFSKQSLSEGIDKQMYRAYLEQKVLEGKISFDQSNESYFVVVDSKNEKTNKKSLSKKVKSIEQKELDILIHNFKTNDNEFQQFLLMELEKRQEHFEAMRDLRLDNDNLLKKMANLCQEHGLKLKSLKKRLPKTCYKDLDYILKLNEKKSG
ncbi:MAG: hypothetical protein ABJI22_13055 [Maribacter sp.]